MIAHKTRPEHEVAYQDLIALLRKNEVTAPELLAIAANMIGKIVAMQDQRTMTRETAMRIVAMNIEEGNKQTLELLMASKGSA